jgi:hypothetical protein
MYDVSRAENDKEMPQNASLDFKMANPSKLAKLLQLIESNENIFTTHHFHFTLQMGTTSGCPWQAFAA